MELIRSIVRVGNSAGVVLPREWLHGKAKVVLIEKVLDPEKEVFDILRDYLQDIVALAIVGSYARGEESAESDVDVLAISLSTNKRIQQGKYEIILVSEDVLKKQLDKNILPLLPMIMEAKPLINHALIEKYKFRRLSKKNLAFHFDTTKSAMNVIKAQIALAQESREVFLSDSTSYSLILRLRELYLVDCLLKNKMWSKKELLHLIKKIAGSLKAYEGYVRAKNDEKPSRSLPLSDAKKLHEYVSHNIREQEKSWVKIRG